MADEVIRAPAVQSTPAGYQVPAAQEIVVKSVRALVDGSGAASAFLPTLQLVSPAGDVVWESATDSTVAAGGSADVSWFPGVKSAASSVTPAGSGLPWMFSYAVQTIPYNGGSFSFAGLSNTNFWTSTGDTSIFELVDDGGGRLVPQLQVEGLYRAHLFMDITSVAGAAGNRGVIRFTGAFYPVGGTRGQPFLQHPGALTYDCGAECIAIMNMSAAGTTPPHFYPIQVAQDTGADQTFQTVTCWIEQVNPTGNNGF